MKFIDIHTHIYPPAISEKATQSVCRFYDIHSDKTGTAEELIETDRKIGIYKSVIHPVSINPVHTESINSFTLRQCILHPELVPFATVHIDNDVAATASRFEEQGFKGVKLHPDMQKFNVDDERLFGLYDIIQGHLPLMVHAGDPRYSFSHPERIKHILHEFPRLTVIAAHLGGWSMQETAFPILKDERRCLTDTSSAITNMTPELAVKYIRGYGAERVMFGSDYPVGYPEKEVKFFSELGLTDDEFERISYKNASELLNI